MAEYSISSANLSTIERNLQKLVNQLNQVNKEVDMVTGVIRSVDAKVDSVSSSLDHLAAEFRRFVDESARIATLADAKQNVVILEQKVETEFGHYENVRKHTVGILQAADLRVVKKETIANVTEEMMLATPRYWLAPALIALSAWLGDDKDLAERALKEAMKRDDEKTSLLFCLISKRAGRLNGSIAWLERYFAMQDPTKMERRVILVLDAFASGLFGADSNGICSDKIRGWLEELSGRAGFVESQRKQWSKAIQGKKAVLDDDEFPYLAEISPTWPQLRESLAWAATHEDIYDYFQSIFNAPVSNATSLSVKIDELLDHLVKNYDNEELPLRRELRQNYLVIEERGNADSAKQRFKSEETAYEVYEDFSQHLTSIALSPESSGALVATQKLAISLSKDWILDAYEDMTAKSRADVPLEVKIELSDWSGISRDGSNQLELHESLKQYAEQIKHRALLDVKWFKADMVLVIIVATIAAAIGWKVLGPLLIHAVFAPFMAVAAVVLYGFMQKSKAESAKRKIENDSVIFLNKSLDLLDGTLADLVDFRRLWAEKDADYEKVADFIQELRPEQYVSSINGRNVRQVI